MKKLFLGLALGGIALSALALSKVNAEENISYSQDFKYVETIESNTVFDLHSTPGTNFTVNSLNEGDGILRISRAESTGTLGVDFRCKQEGQSVFYNIPDENAVAKIRFRTNSVKSTNVRLYFPSANIGLSSGSLTLNLIGLRENKLIYHDGSSEKTITGTRYDNGLEADTWYEVAVVFEENGKNNDTENPNRDRYHVYLNGEHLYSADIKNTADFIGQIFSPSIQVGYVSADDYLDLDYMHFGPYNGGVATAPEIPAENLEINEEVTLDPTVVAENQEYDLSINDNWTPSFSTENVLEYNEDNNKFVAVGPGTTTITYNFNDPLIKSVTTKDITVAQASGENLVESISLKNQFANNTIELVKGEVYDLDNLFDIAPLYATDPSLDYVSEADNKVYSLNGSNITAIGAGEANLIINSHDKGDATLTVKIKVTDGICLTYPTVGSQFAESGAVVETADIKYQSGSYSGHDYSPITVSKDEMYGPVFAYKGSSGAASNVLAWVPGDKLEANQNYQLVIYVKLVGGTAGRVDLKIDGYKEALNEAGELGYTYNTLFHKELRTESSTIGTDKWVKINGPILNYDEARLDGLKIELVSWNTTNGMTTYVAHPQLVKADGNVDLIGVEGNVGDVSLAESEVSAPNYTLEKAGATAQLNVLQIPTAAILGDVKYTSANPEVATISDKGLITAVADGQTIITVEAAGKKLYLKVVVDIKVEVTEIEVAESVEIEVDNKAFSTPITLTPENATSEILISIADNTVVSNASIVDGQLYIVPAAAGSTTITLTSADDESVTVTINVTVKAASEPTEPEDPTDPSEPSEPEDPTDPSEPTDPVDEPEEPASNNTGMVVGIVVAVVAVVVIAGVVVFIVLKKKKQQ